MEKAYLFSIKGAVYILTEDGSLKSSYVTYGFLKEIIVRQEEILTEMFQKQLREYESKFNVVKILEGGDKKELSSSVEKYISYLKANYSNNDYKYWENYLLLEINNNKSSFDFYNKNIWQKIEALC